MGQLVDGVWRREEPAAGTREFRRQPSVFRGALPEVRAGRYHLYAAWACPWAQRALITRSLRGLTSAVSVTIVDARMGEDGWAFRAGDPDPIGGGRVLPHGDGRADQRHNRRGAAPALLARGPRP